LENPGVKGGIILKWFFRKWDGDMAQNKDKRRPVVNAVTNFSFP
jgi:hypothetical protein